MPFSYTWTPESRPTNALSTVRIRTWDNKPVPQASYTIVPPSVILSVPTQNRYTVTVRTNGDTETAHLDIPVNAPGSSNTVRERLENHVAQTIAETEQRIKRHTVPVVAGPLGNRWAFIGDSITAGASSPNFHGSSYPLYVQLLSNGRIYTQNFGHGGWRTDQLLAVFDTEVAPFRPNVVFLLSGANDISQGRTLEAYKADVRAFYDKVYDLGASLVISTMTPINDDVKNAKVVLWNQWLRQYSSEKGLHLVDSYRIMLDPLTGDIPSAWHSDGLHPNNTARKVHAEAIISQLLPHVNQWSMPIVQDVVDISTTGWSSNFLLTASTNGVPTGWAAYGGSTGFTHSMTTNPKALGGVAQVTMSGGTTVRVFQRAIAPDRWSPGEKIWVGGIAFGDGGVQNTAQIVFRDTTATRYTFTPMRLYDTGVDGGTFGMEIDIPLSATSGTFEVVAGTGNGVVGFAQPTVVNLSRLGAL